MVFCFALVLVQQYQTNTRTAAAKEQAYNKSRNPVSSSLKTLEPLTPITVAQPSSETANTANPTVSAPPQPSKTSGSDAQSAGQQHGSSLRIDVPSTLDKATKKLGL
jgi:hypothetical protein